MSIQDEINRINQNIANTYSALGDMGATLPQTQNSANMASAVRTLPQSGGGDNPVFIVKYVPVISFDPSTGSIEFHGYHSVDKTVFEIIAAANAGKLVVMDVDIGYSLGIVQFARCLLSLYSNNHVNFDAVMDLTGSGDASFLRFTGYYVEDEFPEVAGNQSNDQWHLEVTPLAKAQ